MGLIEQVKRACAAAYHAASYCELSTRQAFLHFGSEPPAQVFPTMGCTTFQSEFLDEACCRHERHYSALNPFTPQLFRRLMLGSDGFRKMRLEEGRLVVLHYAINRKEVREVAKEWATHPDVSGAGLLEDWYSERFHPGSVITASFGHRHNTWQPPGIVGQQQLLKQVAKYLREDPMHIVELLRAVDNAPQANERDFRKVQSIDIVDMLGNPKEIHFDVDMEKLLVQE